MPRFLAFISSIIADPPVNLEVFLTFVVILSDLSSTTQPEAILVLPFVIEKLRVLLPRL